MALADKPQLKSDAPRAKSYKRSSNEEEAKQDRKHACSRSRSGEHALRGNPVPVSHESVSKAARASPRTKSHLLIQ